MNDQENTRGFDGVRTFVEKRGEKAPDGLKNLTGGVREYFSHDDGKDKQGLKKLYAVIKARHKEGYLAQKAVDILMSKANKLNTAGKNHREMTNLGEDLFSNESIREKDESSIIHPFKVSGRGIIAAKRVLSAVKENIEQKRQKNRQARELENKNLQTSI